MWVSARPRTVMPRVGGRECARGASRGQPARGGAGPGRGLIAHGTWRAVTQWREAREQGHVPVPSPGSGRDGPGMARPPPRSPVP